MKRNRLSKALFSVLCLVIAAAAVIGIAGCGNKQDQKPAGDATKVLGEGVTVFTFSVTGTDGSEKTFEIHTDETTVGAALLKVGIIAGEESQYGLYVKTVDGVTLDYATDGKYWAFYVDGAYASSGVDSTEVKNGGVYAFKAE